MTDQEGIYKSKAFNYKKYNVRSNISAEIVKGFTVDLQLSGRLDTRMKPYEAEPLSRSIQMAKPVFPFTLTTIRIIGPIRVIKGTLYICPISTMSATTEEIAVNLTDQSV